MKYLLASLVLAASVYAANELQLGITVDYALNGAMVKYNQKLAITVTNSPVSQPVQTFATNPASFYFGDVGSNALVLVYNTSTNRTLRLATGATNYFGRVKPGEHGVLRIENAGLLGASDAGSLSAQAIIISE